MPCTLSMKPLEMSHTVVYKEQIPVDSSDDDHDSSDMMIRIMTMIMMIVVMTVIVMMYDSDNDLF